jgi:hypothetical protein
MVVETVVVARHIASCLAIPFRFPVSKSKIYSFDNPEIQILSVLAVATKICFPFEPARSSALDPTGTLLPDFNWDTWITGSSGDAMRPDRDAQMHRKFEEITPREITNLDDDEFEAYLTHLSASLNDGSESLD